MLQEALQKIKSIGGFDSTIGRIALEAIVFGAFLVTSFMLGRASLFKGTVSQPIVVLEPNDASYVEFYKNYGKIPQPNVKDFSKISIEQGSPAGAFGASVNGTKYYPRGCSGLSRIKAENMIWFNSKQEAESAGYSLALNC